MIARSGLVLALGLLISTALHLGALALLWNDTPAEMEGGGLVSETSFGSSFADLSEGVQSPETPPLTAQATEAAAPTSVQPGSVTVSAVAPVQTPLTPAVAPDADLSATSDQAVTIAAAPPKVQTAQARPATRAPEAAQTFVTALADTSPATKISARPRMPQNRPDPPKTQPAPRPSAPKGNASRTARAGVQSGRSQAKSQPVQTSNVATRKAEGNAQASNYPGLVMARLARVPRPRSTTRGAATIRFTISDNGRLSAASVTSGSGSTALDRAALSVVRSAQPFPPPPAGARRSYTIKIEGR